MGSGECEASAITNSVEEIGTIWPSIGKSERVVKPASVSKTWIKVKEETRSKIEQKESDLPASHASKKKEDKFSPSG